MSEKHLARFQVLHLSAEVEEHLSTVGEATVTRILRKYRSRKQRLPQKGPERANQVRKPVPMKWIPWDIREAGHFEVDLVQHSGENSEGIYAYTLQMVDVATGWSERVAVLGKGQRMLRHLLLLSIAGSGLLVLTALITATHHPCQL